MKQTKKNTKKKTENNKKYLIINTVIFFGIIVLAAYAYMSTITGVILEAGNLVIYNTKSNEQIEKDYSKEIENWNRIISDNKKELNKLTKDTKEYKQKEEEIEKMENLKYFLAITNKNTTQVVNAGYKKVIIASVIAIAIYAVYLYIRIKNN